MVLIGRCGLLDADGKDPKMLSGTGTGTRVLQVVFENKESKSLVIKWITGEFF